jgi:hypothetical protein
LYYFKEKFDIIIILFCLIEGGRGARGGMRKRGEGERKEREGVWDKEWREEGRERPVFPSVTAMLYPPYIHKSPLAPVHIDALVRT